MVDRAAVAIEPRSWGRRPPGISAATVDAIPADSADAPTIQAALARQVVGQPQALRELSLVLAMHAVGSASRRSLNAIVVGPTGVGKTHTLLAASRFLGLPFIATDATSLVPAGIVGEQVEDVLEGLVRSADEILAAARVPRRRDDDLELAARGVILIDEFDKLATPDDASTSTRADRRVIQRRLLKLAEGARLRVGIKHHEPGYRERFIDTSGILLLASGVFDGLGGPGWHGLGRARPTGRRLEPDDMVGAGFLPELIGRLPLIVSFEPLTVADLVAILDHGDVSPLATWRRYFGAALGAELRIDEAAKWIVAERTAALGMGARGLQHVLFPVIAAKALAAVGGEACPDVVLRASDFLPEGATPVSAMMQ